MDSVRSFSGEEWEARIHRLLKCRYALGDYVEVPDGDGGDAGLDGFARDGRVFQCYAAEEPRDPESLYEAIRDKMTTDLKKFVVNRDRVQRILGSVSATHWLLVVPRVHSARILEHCTRKTDDIRAANLPYATPTFVVSVLTDEEFLREQEVLGLARSTALTIAMRIPPPVGRDIWEEEPGASGLLGNLRRKVGALPDLSEPRRRRLESEMVDAYLRGQAMLCQLSKDYPGFHQAALSLKVAREQTLPAAVLLGDDPPRQQLRAIIEEYRQRLLRALPGLGESNADLLAYEAAADWLLRCPLDFDPEIVA